MAGRRVWLMAGLDEWSMAGLEVHVFSFWLDWRCEWFADGLTGGVGGLLMA